MNTTSNITSDSITALRVTEYVLFIIIFIISVVGNVLVCLVIYKTPSMRTTRNYLLVNLAVADLTVALVCIPFDVVIKVYGSPWPLGAAMCKIIWPSQTLTTMCSAATLSAISYDRYRAVVHPSKPRFTCTQTVSIIATTWMVSLILVLPYVVALRIVGGECDEEWFSPTARQSYTALLFVCQYALPVLVIGLAYTRIVLKLREQALRIARNTEADPLRKIVRCPSEANEGTSVISSPLPSRTKPNKPVRPTSLDVSDGISVISSPLQYRKENTPTLHKLNPPTLKIADVNRRKELLRHKRNAKIVRMLVTVFLMYAICLLPNQIAWMWYEFGSGSAYAHMDSLLTFASLLVYINSSVNPLFYAGMNDEFRKGFLKVLGIRSKYSAPV